MVRGLVFIFYLSSLLRDSILAQRKRVGLITPRSIDRNDEMLVIPYGPVVRISASHSTDSLQWRSTQVTRVQFPIWENGLMVQFG